MTKPVPNGGDSEVELLEKTLLASAETQLPGRLCAGRVEGFLGCPCGSWGVGRVRWPPKAYAQA